ncbi:uncharacterized protein NECHADRAFT_88254 [Fusarium vanettenii 77-13-4]|uniref:Heterokaryon incompatibility domain-containing protein n=1 Tax=Fusarium vanettenii (strain ATCC MYA-4622 / CBS 123669 / FGSC 9596 / NRRL 45880 / 77-13-4) TaxID=660122 RepID=C7ZDY6_FUSV7|nr:uncharacterized protein NECHADRAFT_88254 [Fusarium vanettenii 77-13-4]EEU37812.1 predicted protein [Fusarium vanettenii 77-13-4]
MDPDDAFSRLTSPPGCPYLCASCTDVLSCVGDDPQFPIPGHLTRHSFLKAVANKCFICWRLFQALGSTHHEFLRTLTRYERLEDPTRDYNYPLTRLGINNQYAEYSRISVDSEFLTRNWTRNLDLATLPDLARVIEDMDKDKFIAFDYVLVKMDDYAEDLEISQWIESCTGLVDAMAWEDTIDLIGKWIRACDMGHKQCNDRARDTSWFPTRVLDLAPPEFAKSDGEAVKVIEREQVVPGSRYVTLSHRWNEHIPKLTSSNLKARLQKIPFENLTKTFRDFITVSRRLGVRYAWIDSLCIIQESEHGGSDWAQECLTMDLVYRNSFCNLSADWPTDSDGFFLDRKVRQFDLPTIKIKFDKFPTTEDSEDSEDIKDIEGGEEQEFEFLLVDNDTWDCEVTKSPINSRGWVLQERFLSPRVLHFCRNEVFFECCETQKFERFRRSMPAIDRLVYDPFKNIVQKFDGTYDTESCHRVWRRVPEIYNNCKLTYPDDKLVAVSGIARYLKTYLVDDVYVMGIWASDINAQMLWVCETIIRPYVVDCQTLGELEPLSETAVQAVSTPLRQCKGPTFSWVSTDQLAVSFFTNHKLSITRKSVCECTRLVKYREGHAPFDDEPITEDIFDYPGQPMVELKVAGLLRRVRLIDTGSTLLRAVFLDENDGRSENYGSLRHDPYNTTLVSLDFAVDPSEIPNIESRVCFCILWADSDSDYTTTASVPPPSIILELVDLEMGRFRRIGMMLNSRLIQGSAVDYPGWNYDPKTGLHTIYII